MGKGSTNLCLQLGNSRVEVEVKKNYCRINVTQIKITVIVTFTIQQIAMHIHRLHVS